MIFISLICLIGTIIISKSIFKSYINPMNLFLGNFFFAMMLYYSVDFIDHNLSSTTILILVSSFISFIYGMLIAAILFKRKNNQSNLEDKTLGLGIRLEHIKFFKILFWLSILGFISFLMTLQNSIGLVSILKNPNLLNLAISENSIIFSSIPAYLMKISMINSLFLLVYILKFKPKNKSIYIMYFLEIFMNVSVKRNVLIYILVLNILVYIYYNQGRISEKIKKSSQTKKIITLFFVSGIILFYFASTQKLLNKELLYQGNIFGLKISNSLMTILTYYIANFKSFDIYLTTDIVDSAVFGSSLRFVYQFFESINFVHYDSSFLSLDFVSVPQLFNTSIAQIYIYAEGGLGWIILFYSFLGYFSSSLYFSYFKYRNDFKLIGLAIMSNLLLFSIREYVVLQIDFWISVFILFLFSVYAKRKI